MKRLRADQEEEGEMEETIKTANLLLSLACGGEPKRIHRRTKPEDGMFECKTCGRRFPSFQALGGHRTSHKRQRLQGLGLDPMQGPRSKPAVHECSICRQAFPTGQALGGHMRRHKPLGEKAAAFPGKKAAAVDKAMLDFNLLLPLEDDDSSRLRSHGVLLKLFV